LFVGPPDIATARKLLGSDKIIGISTNTVDEALTACEQGADYLGIGTVFSTQTYVCPLLRSRYSHLGPSSKLILRIKTIARRT
jgi:thiamine monophosphate synthase